MLNSSKLVFAGLLAVGAASAATIYDNGGPDLSGSGNNLSDLLQADDFSLGGTFDLNGFRFWSLEAAGAFRGSFYYAIHQDATGQPGSLIVSGTATPTRTADGVVTGLNSFINDVSISPATLGAGTYWLVLHNGTLSQTDFLDFYWATTATGGGATGREQSLMPPSATWDDNSVEHAFLLTGTPNTGSPIPEPSTYAMIASIFLLGAAKRARGRKGNRGEVEQLDDTPKAGTCQFDRLRGSFRAATPNHGPAAGPSGPVQ